MKLLMKPWQQCRIISLSVLTVLMVSGTPLTFADNDLGVTMRMVTDEDVTRSVTREIPLPPTVPEPGPDNPGNDSNDDNKGPGARGPEGRGPAGGPPGLQGPARNRDVDRGRRAGPPERARDRIPGSARGHGPDSARDRGPGRGRPDNPGRGRPDNPGRGNRPDKP